MSVSTHFLLCSGLTLFLDYDEDLWPTVKQQVAFEKRVFYSACGSGWVNFGFQLSKLQAKKIYVIVGM